MEISWTDRVRNEEVLQRVKEERSIVQTIKRRKANWIGHILRGNCLLKHVTEGKVEGMIEVTGGRGRRRKEVIDELKEARDNVKLREEALDGTVWRTGFERSYRPVVRQTRECMNEWMDG
jgi:ribosomal 50S subunit-associated protein YjgA (DUF615 family)